MMTAYTTPVWMRELVLGVAPFLGGRQSDVATAALVVMAADRQFGFTRAVETLPEDQRNDPEYFDDPEGPLTLAKLAFWNSVRKIARAADETESTKVVRAALLERGRSAFVHVSADESRYVLTLAAEAVAQAVSEGRDLRPETWGPLAVLWGGEGG